MFKSLFDLFLDVTSKVGLLVGKGGYYGNAVRIAPPLSATKEHVEEALEKMDYALGQVMEMSL